MPDIGIVPHAPKTPTPTPLPDEMLVNSSVTKHMAKVKRRPKETQRHTFAISHMLNRVLILHILHNTANELFRPVRRRVHRHQTIGAFGLLLLGRHGCTACLFSTLDGEEKK